VRRAWKTLGVAAAAVLLAAGVVACGGSSSSSSSSSSTTTTSSTQAESKSGSGTESQQGAGKQPGQGREPAGSDGGETHAPVAKSHHDSGGGAAQFRVKGGDNSVQEFGAEAGGSELDEAAATLHGFFDARAEGDWTKACTYVAASVTGSLQKLAGSSKQLKGKGCGAILEAVSGGVPRSTLEEAAEADVGALRVEGDRSFLLYHGAHNTNYAIPMAKEDGAWKVAALAGTPLS
jgi:hypothetical protein